MNASYVTSRDGTRVAYERIGTGAPVILIGGALNDRHGKASGLPLARALASDFSVIAYDRRGRGDSTNVQPYAVAREIEDLAALVAAAGGAAALFGMSSGGALAIAAAAGGVNATRVALYEVPFSADAAAQERAIAYDRRLRELLAGGDDDGALALFLTFIGMPPPVVAQMRGAPMWPGLAAMAPGLAHDSAVMAFERGGALPAAQLQGVPVPVLALSGENSPPFMGEVATRIATTVGDGHRRTLAGQTHDVAVDALAPVLKSFFGNGSKTL